MSAPKPLRWAEVDSPDVERRTYIVLGETSEMGRSRVAIQCPFCLATVTAFLWSLAGGGKRCGCGALLNRRGEAFRRKREEDR